MVPNFSSKKVKKIKEDERIMSKNDFKLSADQVTIFCNSKEIHAYHYK